MRFLVVVGAVLLSLGLVFRGRRSDRKCRVSAAEYTANAGLYSASLG